MQFAWYVNCYDNDSKMIFNFPEEALLWDPSLCKGYLPFGNGVRCLGCLLCLIAAGQVAAIF